MLGSDICLGHFRRKIQINFLNYLPLYVRFNNSEVLYTSLPFSMGYNKHNLTFNWWWGQWWTLLIASRVQGQHPGPPGPALHNWHLCASLLHFHGSVSLPLGFPSWALKVAPPSNTTTLFSVLPQASSSILVLHSQISRLIGKLCE